jgi:hypothetical protein
MTHSYARVVAGTTSDEYQPSTPSDNRQVCLQTTKGNGSSVKVDSTSHSVDDRFGLFVDFLLHKVVELSLHDSGKLDFQSLNGSNGRKTVILSQSVDVQL